MGWTFLFILLYRTPWPSAAGGGGGVLVIAALWVVQLSISVGSMATKCAAALLARANQLVAT